MNQEEIEFQIEELRQIQNEIFSLAISFGNVVNYLEDALKED